MSQGITTSIRLPTNLRSQLEQASHALHRGKNWIITQALEEYLSKIEHSTLAEEARRQSILASKTDQHIEDWEDNMDTTGWK